MTLRVALRSLATRPVRSAVLACGFGFGISVMAALLGIGEVILEQARSPALAGGGDLVVSGAGGTVPNARFVLWNLAEGPPLAGRAAALSPWSRTTLYLVGEGSVEPVEARGGIPGLERAMEDPETSGIGAWTDTPSDEAWSRPDPADVLRAMDRFHPVPDVPARAASWAEWLYFNGSARDARFYLTFLVGPREPSGRRPAGVRLQLDRGGRLTTYSERAEVSEEELLARAPDVRIGRCRLRLEGLRYRLTLELDEERSRPASGKRRRALGGPGPHLTGEITLDAILGRAIPPLTIRGARGWISGYTVPVLSGPLGGSVRVGGEVIPLQGGAGYHDHNWGFWEGVTWQWGQVSGEGLSFLYGRIRPPADAADPDRIPGFLAVLGPEGPLGFATRVTIEETDGPVRGEPGSIRVRARGPSLDLLMDLAVEATIRTDVPGSRAGPGRRGLDFLQMRTACRVSGRVGTTAIDFTAPGTTETFRGD